MNLYAGLLKVKNKILFEKRALQKERALDWKIMEKEKQIQAINTFLSTEGLLDTVKTFSKEDN